MGPRPAGGQARVLLQVQVRDSVGGFSLFWKNLSDGGRPCSGWGCFAGPGGVILWMISCFWGFLGPRLAGRYMDVGDFCGWQRVLSGLVFQVWEFLSCFVPYNMLSDQVCGPVCEEA